MTKRPNIVSREGIESAIQPVSHDDYFMEIQRRRAEKEAGWFVASAGILLGSFQSRTDEVVRSEDSFATLAKLQGAENKLNRQTFIYAQSFRLPSDSTPEGIDAFLVERWKYPELQRNIGFVAINEPGFAIFNPIKTEASGYIETSNQGIDLAADGLEAYLNSSDGIHMAQDSREEIAAIIAATKKRLPLHKKRTREAFLKAVEIRRNG